MPVNKLLAIETAIALIYDTYFHSYTQEEDKYVLDYLLSLKDIIDPKILSNLEELINNIKSLNK